MTMREFIKQNKNEIDSAIQSVLKRPDLKLNNAEREQWILNDEGLYRWARQNRVRI